MHIQPTPPGIRVSLAELIEMRHRVREVQLFSTPSQRSPLIGLHHSKLRGRGVDFDQVRVYQAGDDVRTIDWRVTARTQEPHTKLFHEERERPIFIMVEQSRRLFFGSGLMFKSVLAAQAASLIGWAAPCEASSNRCRNLASLYWRRAGPRKPSSVASEPTWRVSELSDHRPSSRGSLSVCTTALPWIERIRSIRSVSAPCRTAS